MKIGLVITRFNWPASPSQDGPSSPDNIGPKLAEITKTADQVGFDSIWVYDHFFQIAPSLGKVDDPMLEAYTTLGYLAAVTKKAKLGVLVCGVIYRDPALLVKAATTFDVLSGGRTYFGIGAAWYEREAIGLGFPFPSVKERFERLEETLQIAKQMWSGDTKPFKGTHYQLAEPINSPQPLTKPHPPIMIGGMGEKKTLRFVAQYGDACNLFADAGRETLVHKLDVLKAHCQNLGRSYNDIERTVLTTSPINIANVTDACSKLAEIGIQHTIFNIPNVDQIKPLEIFGKDIIPKVKKF